MKPCKTKLLLAGSAVLTRFNTLLFRSTEPVKMCVGPVGDVWGVFWALNTLKTPKLVKLSIINIEQYVMMVQLQGLLLSSN